MNLSISNNITTKEFNINNNWLRNNILNNLKIIDQKGYQNLTNKDKRLFSHIQNKFEFKLKQLVSEQIKWLHNSNVGTIVMEDLNLSQTTKGRRNLDNSDIFYGFNLNRLVRLFHLSSIKHYFKQQQENRNIKVEFVNQKYTSQKCPICGNIDKNNRKIQEVFKCTKCGYTNNQDINQTVNILLKYLENVFQEKIKVSSSLSPIKHYINNLIYFNSV